jgi:hypothetical protein
VGRVYTNVGKEEGKKSNGLGWDSHLVRPAPIQVF